MRPVDADELVMFPYSEGPGTEEQIAEWIEQAGLSEDDTADRARELCWMVIEGCINVVKTQPTLTPPNEWVSVEQAMPPEHDTVLCIVSGKLKPNITLEEAYQLGSWNKADGWIIDEWLDWEGANVTWWMKLPAPPNRRPPEGEADA